MEVNKIYTGDSKEILKTLPDNSINCIVTSPPYYGLRDYGMDGQMGLEETPDEYISNMVALFRECKRALKKDGTLWVNIGDSYANAGNLTPHKGQRADRDQSAMGFDRSHIRFEGLKQKDLVGIPWMLAFALRADGWYLRQDIIWHKLNPMPESVTDRCTKSHEYIFLLSKSSKYFYDAEAIKQAAAESTIGRGPVSFGGEKGRNYKPKESDPNFRNGSEQWGRTYEYKDGNVNKRSVWSMSLKPFPEAHFATFPEELIVDCIKSGCPEYICNKCGKPREKIINTIVGSSKECPKTVAAHEARGGKGIPKGTVGKSGGSRVDSMSEIVGLTDCGCNAGFSAGIVLDPFSGAGTTALVAAKLNRNYIGIELNPEYVKIAEKRLRNELGMFYKTA